MARNLLVARRDRQRGGRDGETNQDGWEQPPRGNEERVYSYVLVLSLQWHPVLMLYDYYEVCCPQGLCKAACMYVVVFRQYRNNINNNDTARNIAGSCRRRRETS